MNIKHIAEWGLIPQQFEYLEIPGNDAKAAIAEFKARYPHYDPPWCVVFQNSVYFPMDYSREPRPQNR